MIGARIMTWFFGPRSPDVSAFDAARDANIAAHQDTASAASGVRAQVAEQQESAEATLSAIQDRRQHRQPYDANIRMVTEALKVMESRS